MKYWLQPYEFVSETIDDGQGGTFLHKHWKLPDNIMGAIDMRSIPTATSKAEPGYAYVATDNDQNLPDGILIASIPGSNISAHREIPVTAQMRSAWNSILGIADTDAEWVFELSAGAISYNSSPEGDVPVPTMTASSRNFAGQPQAVLQYIFGDDKSESPVNPQKTVYTRQSSRRFDGARTQHHYRRRLPDHLHIKFREKMILQARWVMRKLIQQSKIDLSRLVLWDLKRRLAAPDWKQLVDVSERNHHPGPLKPSTIRQDDFENGVNGQLVVDNASSTVDWTEGGADNQFKYAGFFWSGDVRGVSFANASAGNPFHLLDNDPYGSSAHRVIVQQRWANGPGGPFARVDSNNSTAPTGYYAFRTGNAVSIYRTISGTPTQISTLSGTVSDYQYDQITADGSTITLDTTGSAPTQVQVTDTQISDGFYSGVMTTAVSSAAFIGEYESEDLTPPTMEGDQQSNGILDGTAATTLVLSADQIAAADLSGTASQVVNLNGDLLSTAILDGTTSTTYPLAAELQSDSILDGSATTAFILSGDHIAAAILDGSASTGFVLSGDLVANGILDGSATTFFYLIADQFSPTELDGTAVTTLVIDLDQIASGVLDGDTINLYLFIGDQQANGILDGNAIDVTILGDQVANAALDGQAIQRLLLNAEQEITGVLDGTVTTTLIIGLDQLATGVLISTAIPTNPMQADMLAEGIIFSATTQSLVLMADHAVASELNGSAVTAILLAGAQLSDAVLVGTANEYAALEADQLSAGILTGTVSGNPTSTKVVNLLAVASTAKLTAHKTKAVLTASG